MSKKFFIIACLAVASSVAILGLLRTKKSFAYPTVIASNTHACIRSFVQKTNNSKWLLQQNNALAMDSFFSTSPTTITAIVKSNNTIYPTIITLTQFTKDSILVDWSFTYNTSMLINILQIVGEKEQQVIKAIQAHSNALKQYLQSRKVYGFKADITVLQDSTLITLKDSSTTFPTTNMVYSNINTLYQYAAANNAVATNAPMFNVQQKENTYYWMVAIPISKNLPPYKNIVPKRMLKNGFFIQTDSIFGGTYTIDSLFKNFELYKNDYHLSSPAIPFQSFITDRSKQPDSTKWVTRFYYPIF
jgi:hypothetical protein